MPDAAKPALAAAAASPDGAPQQQSQAAFAPSGSPTSAPQAAAALWCAAGLPQDALDHLDLHGPAAAAPSSFAVTAAVQASLGLAGLAAAELWHQRAGDSASARQQVRVDSRHAVAECQAWLALDGQAPALWDPVSGLYPCGAAVGVPGWVRIHANFAHHRDGALRLLGLAGGTGAGGSGSTSASTSSGTSTGTGSDQPIQARIAEALRHWTAEAFETAAAEAGLVVAAARSAADWAAHPQAAVLQGQPPVQIERLGPAPARPLAAAARPLQGVRVLDLTRILAGPVAARTLAAHGADVLMLNAPHLPNIAAIADMSRGKRSALLDFRAPADRACLDTLLQGADVLLQGYRPGALAAFGCSAETLARQHPGLVVAELSAYGNSGPWGQRRGFDSLVQTATGLNHDEARAFGQAEPRALPLQALDYSAGFLLAFGIQAALWRRAQEGGSWQVTVSLAAVAQWLRSLGRTPGDLAVPLAERGPWLHTEPSGWGQLTSVRHAAQLSATPARCLLPSMPPGSHAPAW